MSTDFGAGKKPAREKLLELLSDKIWHTWKECEHAGGMRYSARLLELKRQGWVIESRGSASEGKDYRLLGRGPKQTKKVRVLLEEAEVQYLLAMPGLPLLTRQKLQDAYGSFKANRGKL